MILPDVESEMIQSSLELPSVNGRSFTVYFHSLPESLAALLC